MAQQPQPAQVQAGNGGQGNQVNWIVVIVVTAIISSLISGSVGFLLPTVIVPSIVGRPDDRIVTHLMDLEAETVRDPNINLIYDIYAPGASITDQGCATTRHAQQSWVGLKAIKDRYDGLIKGATFLRLEHLHPLVTWDPPNRYATKATATAQTSGIINRGGGEEYLSGLEQWEFTNQPDGKWRVSLFVYNVCPSSTSSPPPSQISLCDQPQPGKIALTGLAYGPYHKGQGPGTAPSKEEIQADMPTLTSLTHCIRLYSSTGAASTIVQAAEANHISVALGIALSNNRQENEREIAAAEQLVATYKAVRAVIVGNEVWGNPRNDQALLHAELQKVYRDIQQANKASGRSVLVTAAEEYYVWLHHPELADNVDFLTVHIYPFWQKQSMANAIQFLNGAYQMVKASFPNKPIVIGETGWPSEGGAYGQAIANSDNQVRYLKDFSTWAQRNNVQYFYFEAFDEDWKSEQGFGPHWGLYQQDGKLKPALSSLLPAADPATLTQRSYLDVYVGGGSRGFEPCIDTSQQQRQWLTSTDGSLLLTYPANQQWGVMFIRVQPPSATDQCATPPGPHPSLDLSGYHSLVFDIRATVGSPSVQVGIKDWQQPNNGTETKKSVSLTTQWVKYTLPLSYFSGADLKHLYVVFEVVFAGTSNITVEVGNIRYSPT